MPLAEPSLHPRGRVEQFLVVPKSQRDRLELRLVDDLGANGFQDDGEADLFRGRREVLEPTDESGLRGLDPVGRQHRVRLVVEEPRPTFFGRAGQDRRGAVAVHGKRPLRPLVPFSILPVAIHRGEGARGALWEQVRGDAMAHEFHETGTVLGPAEEVAQHGLGVRLRGLPHCAGDVHLVDPHRRNVDGDRGVDARIGQDRLERPPIVLEGPLRRQVDRVSEGRFRGGPGVHEGLGRRRQLREAQALCDEFVDAHDRGTAGVGDDGHSIAPRKRLKGEGHREIEQLLNGAGPKHPGLREHSLRREVGTPEGSRVRCGRSTPGLGAARLDGDDRFLLRGRPGDPDEVLRVPKILDVREDDFGLRVGPPRREQVVQAHLGLVPQGAELREADPERPGMFQDGDAERAALRDQRDASPERRRRREGRVHSDVGMRVDDAHAVRTDQREAVRLADAEEAGFSLDADPTDLPETRRDHDESSHAFLAAGLRGIDREVGGDGDHREIDGIRHVRDAGIRADPVDAGRVRIHGVEDPLVFVDDQIPQDLVADFSTMARGPDDRDGSRRKDRVESLRGHPAAKFRRRNEPCRKPVVR